MSPAFESIPAERPGRLRVVKVSVEQAPDVSAELGVQGISTMMMFDNGAEVTRQAAPFPPTRSATGSATH